MPSEPHCDLHGPYTVEEAARILLGEWKPERTGYVCLKCQAALNVVAKQLADQIDAECREAWAQETKH